MTADGKQTAVLVGVVTRDAPKFLEPPLEELSRLAETAGAVVLERFTQKSSRIHPATYIGKGKAMEVGEVAAALGVDLIIFDHDLSPAQGRNLEKILDCRVLDRSELILDIFARRARTRPARVQVELAQLEYLRPRLRRMWTHLSRMEGGIGMRGPGEKQIEVDRRIIRRRIQILRKELNEIERRRQTRGKARRGFFAASLVGYTNAGKSSLLQRLTGADTFIEDQLFATLDTTTRAWSLDGGNRVFLSDTVGFIRGLPHHLVASFHATLDEVREADLLLHVVDASNPDCHLQVATVEEVLSGVGASSVPVITVLNKIDLLKDRMTLLAARPRNGHSLDVSARTGEGIAALEAAVIEQLEAAQEEIDLCVDAGDGKLLAFLAEKGKVLSREYGEEGEVRLRVRLAQRWICQLPDGVRARAVPQKPSEARGS